MKKIYIFLALLLLCGSSSLAQVGINTDSSQPDASAMLDVKSTSKGFLPPRMTTAQMNSIVAPGNGLLVYNTSVNSLYWYNGLTWSRFNEMTFTETDPIFTAHPAYGITAASITSWNTAFSWGPHAGLYPPLARTLTINGSTQDLSANRTWSVGTVTSIAATAPLTGGTITGTGTIGIQPATSIANGYLSSADWNTFNSKVSSQWTTSGSDIYYSTGNVSIGGSTMGFIAGATRYLNLSAPAVGGTQISSFELKGSTASANTAVNRIDFLSHSGAVINNIARIEARITSTSAKGDLLFYTNGVTLAERMRIDENGEVGIGTSFPGSPLHVESNQSGLASAVIFGKNTYTGTNPWVYSIKGEVNSSSTNASGPGIGVWGLSGNTAGGGVGVFGTSDGSTGYGVKALGGSATGVNYGLYAATNSNDGYAGYFNGGKNYFSGNVGIGETSPTSPLHVVSDQSVAGSNVAYVNNTYSGTNTWIYAIKGQVNTTSTYAAGPGVGVYGVSGNSVGGGVGIWGQSNGLNGIAVRAQATSSTGVNYGLYAGTNSDYGFGAYLYGGNYALYAVTSNPVGYAGYFSGGKNYFSGDVGIGTTTPAGKLHVNDPASSNTMVLITPKAIGAGDSSSLFLGEDRNGLYGMYWMYDGAGNLMQLWGKGGTITYGPHLSVNRDNGNMAIGSAFATGYKLSVNGKIICTELRVNLVADWPDYVFKKDYKLLPVEKLGAYIQENGHLPNIPLAEEINKSGLDVGEMQKRMMEKIEELSLYIVEQQKQIQALKEQLNKGR